MLAREILVDRHLVGAHQRELAKIAERIHGAWIGCLHLVEIMRGSQCRHAGFQGCKFVDDCAVQPVGACFINLFRLAGGECLRQAQLDGKKLLVEGFGLHRYPDVLFLRLESDLVHRLVVAFHAVVEHPAEQQCKHDRQKEPQEKSLAFEQAKHGSGKLRNWGGLPGFVSGEQGAPQRRRDAAQVLKL
ncbi:MAG: hypothetical protein HEQ37_13770 [Acidovorax sp.]|nr:hypothetical protein [Acidovorax sp.]